MISMIFMALSKITSYKILQHDWSIETLHNTDTKLVKLLHASQPSLVQSFLSHWTFTETEAGIAKSIQL